MKRNPNVSLSGDVGRPCPDLPRLWIGTDVMILPMMGSNFVSLRCKAATIQSSRLSYGPAEQAIQSASLKLSVSRGRGIQVPFPVPVYRSYWRDRFLRGCGQVSSLNEPNYV